MQGEKLIKENANVRIYTTNLETQDGELIPYIIVGVIKKTDFLKDSRGKNWYNVVGETREWYKKDDYEKLQALCKS